ncbi:BTAD domain-containing putative transcriptional regulator [Actinomadura sp. NPDC049382]|uniref:BTAD domain-containing putative transcriptional regulator n=1 Tax=Actinomadura sp. NPDC049382 TaxID=3158220 RepID=UPI00344A4BC2
MIYTGRSRLDDFVRGLIALVIFLFFLVGCPVAMYAMGGSPIPDRIPSWEEISATLMRQDSDQSVFLATIFLIGWGAWCLFMITVCSEAVNYLTGRSRSAAPRPVRPLQELVRTLVATATLTFSAAASLASSASAATTMHAATGVHAAAGPESGEQGHLSPAQDAPPQGSAESEWTPLLADEPPARPKSDHHEARTHVVKRGETLWGLARRTYGSGDRYPEIFENSRNIDQPNGIPALTDPDVIHPGQFVRLPRLSTPEEASSPSPAASPRPKAHKAPPEQETQSSTRTPAPPSSTSGRTTTSPVPSPVVAPPADHSASPAPSAPNDQDDAGSPLAISLPSGSLIGLGLAAALSVAVAATRLHRRRRRPLPSDPDAAEYVPEPPIPTPVLKAHKAHLDIYADREASVPSDPELVRKDLLTPEPDHLVVGTRDGQAVTIPLAGLSLGLSGDGAHAAARAITTELLPKSRRYRAEIVIPGADADALFPGTDITGLARAVEGLIITPSPNEAVEHLEAELLRRSRMRQTAELPDVAALRIDDPAEPLPTMLLVAAAPTHDATAVYNSATVHALAMLGRRYSIGVLLLGTWEVGTGLALADDGTVTVANGPCADQFTGARLFHLTVDDASDMLQTIQTATGSEPIIPAPVGSASTTPEPAPESAHSLVPPPRPSTEGRQAPARLQVLGPVLLHTADGPITSGMRKCAKQLLAYLALHPKGATRDQAIGALWPDLVPESAVIQFNTATTNIRKALRTATGLTEPKYVLHTAGHYRIDPDLIDVDLWQLTTTLMDAEQADDESERVNALAPVSDLYTGEFASGLEYEWANAHREYLRRAVIDALGHFVQLTQQEQPGRALATLERAITYDPYSEPLYREVMRLQARLGRPDAVRRTYQLLESRLDEIDAEPGGDTHQLMATLSRPKPNARIVGTPPRRQQ